MGRGKSNRVLAETRSPSSAGGGNDQFELLTTNAVDVLPAGQLQEELAAGKKLRVKLGVDPTAPDLHLGHTVVLNALKRFADEGHDVILIIGDQTAMVGDPTGKSKTRPVLSPEEVAKNAETFVAQVSKIIDRDKLTIEFNSSWLEMSSKELFKVLANNTVSQILDRDDFSKRYQQGKPISMLEMVYPILQAYDSVAIDADIEVGGTDQKFNLLLGRELQGKMTDKRAQSILTLPILSGLDGKEKMSKSLDNYIGLNDSPEDMYAKTLSIPDENLSEYYQLLFSEEKPDMPPRDSKRLLARKIVSRFYSEQESQSAENVFDQKFGKANADLKEVAEKTSLDSEVMSDDEKTVHLPALLGNQFSMTRTEVRRHLKNGAVKLDGKKIDNIDLDTELVKGSVLSVGKRNLVYIDE